MSLLAPTRNHLPAEARSRAVTEHSVSSQLRQQHVWSLSDDVTSWIWFWSNPWLADEGREDEWGLIRSCWENSNRQKSSKPPRDPAQSACQKRMKSAAAEATQRLYFNAIQFALTATDTKWVIILHCSFLNKACVNCFSTAWSQCYINSVLWKHLRILDVRSTCQRRRQELF